jgi:hypothetical protein
MSYYFAKALGCNPVICVGLDLAFVNNKTYADGRELEVTTNGEINAACPGTHNDAFNKKLTYIKDCNGQMIPTRDDYALFIRQFEDILANEDIKVINTSISGAYIQGMEYMEFEQVINSLDLSAVNTNEILTDIYQKTGDEWLKGSNIVLRELNVQREKTQNINSKCRIVTSELQDILNCIGDNERKQEALNRLDNIKNDFIALRNDIINDPYISTYMQPFIWTYSQTYKLSSIPSIEEIIFNMNLEFDFFSKGCIATDEILQWIDQVLEKNKAVLTSLR